MVPVIENAAETETGRGRSRETGHGPFWLMGTSPRVAACRCPGGRPCFGNARANRRSRVRSRPWSGTPLPGEAAQRRCRLPVSPHASSMTSSVSRVAGLSLPAGSTCGRSGPPRLQPGCGFTGPTVRPWLELVRSPVRRSLLDGLAVPPPGRRGVRHPAQAANRRCSRRWGPTLPGGDGCFAASGICQGPGRFFSDCLPSVTSNRHTACASG